MDFCPYEDPPIVINERISIKREIYGRLYFLISYLYLCFVQSYGFVLKSLTTMTSSSPIKTGFFAGSFDPFTLGHADIVEQALRLLDRIIIGIGTHPSKHTLFSAEQRKIQIESVYQHDPRVEVLCYNTLTIDAARQCGAQCLIRGVRTATDFEYEQNLAYVNANLEEELTTMLLLSSQDKLHISSSMIRELLSWHRDASPYVPEGMPLSFSE